MTLYLGVHSLASHDGSVAMFDDAQHRVTALEEERVTRDKHSVGRAPMHALAAIASEHHVDFASPELQFARPWFQGTPMRVSDERTGAERTEIVATDTPDDIHEMLARLNEPAPVQPTVLVRHHLAHALVAAWQSPYDSGVALVCDGYGDGESGSSWTFARGQVPVRLDSIPVDDSLGEMYAAVTRYLGLGTHAEGRTMALAAYADGADTFDCVAIGPEGWRVNLAPEPGTIFSPTRRAWLRHLEFRFGPPVPRSYWSATLGADASTLADDATFQRAVAVAGLAQRTLEAAVGEWLAAVSSRHPETPLVLGGGVFLNCAMNGALRRRFPGLRMFFCPLAGDAGTSIGAAIGAMASLAGRWPDRHPHLDLGLSFPDAHIEPLLRQSGVDFIDAGDELPQRVADLLRRGALVGVFHGRSEFGPRALGQRSLLALADGTATAARVNAAKQRALWRPLAPVVREADVAQFLAAPRAHSAEDLRYMIVAMSVADQFAAAHPAVTHVDGTARALAVGPSGSGGQVFLDAVLSGLAGGGAPAVLINTSLNDAAEPMVLTPKDALRYALASPLDALAIGGFLVTKRGR
ncbi:carbamoyltransferase C-terminal domain-containing protein [Rugosimonospora acidiphila]|uniref:carbamoyltransferase C-terminal domain-containing protein n=1 Tax=Rugosimonospora acidiphila TaxID=556531 RepID=UPI0031E7C0F6